MGNQRAPLCSLANERFAEARQCYGCGVHSPRRIRETYRSDNPLAGCSRLSGTCCPTRRRPLRAAGVERFNTNTGRHIAHARGDGNVILLGRRAIFAANNRLQALDADTRRVTTLVHVAHPITNVQLAFTSEGARIAWTEETARRTAVRELR